MGRMPRDVLAVARRCSHGFPQVILSSPALDGRPFPELLWLTCPWLVRVCSRAEQEGMLRRLRAAMNADDCLVAAVREANKRFADFRGRLASALGVELPPSARAAGIGGTSDRERLKCLHAIAAAGLVGFETPAFTALVEAVGRLECAPPPECARMMEGSDGS